MQKWGKWTQVIRDSCYELMRRYRVWSAREARDSSHRSALGRFSPECMPVVNAVLECASKHCTRDLRLSREHNVSASQLTLLYLEVLCALLALHSDMAILSTKIAEVVCRLLDARLWRLGLSAGYQSTLLHHQNALCL